MSNNCVIFPTDFSDVSVEALPWAKQMADSMNAGIKCLYIVEEPQIYTSLDMGATAIPTTGELLDSAKTRMTKFVADNLVCWSGGCPDPAADYHLRFKPLDSVNPDARVG